MVKLALFDRTRRGFAETVTNIWITIKFGAFFYFNLQK